VKPDIFSGEQQKLLADRLDPKHVKGRSQGGQSLSYIEGWHAIAEANRIFGFGAWERELVEWKETNRDLVDVTKNNRTEKQWRVGYIAKVRVTVHGEGGSRSREGVGFGSGFAKDNALGEAIESAIKEAETDAMKRGMMTFGNQFGLALYDKTRANVGASTLTEEDEEETATERHAPTPPEAKKPAGRPRASRGAELPDEPEPRSAHRDPERSEDEHWIKRIIFEVGKSDSEASLTDLMSKSKRYLHGLKERHEPSYKKVLAAFTSRRVELNDTIPV
jgi:DNA repair and recombination protein RAD52